MANSDQYLIVSASLKSKSRSRIMAEFCAACFRDQKIEPGFIDLRDQALPLCDGESAYGHLNVALLNRRLGAARVIIAATPVYNYDVNATLKNLLELTGGAWENKIVGFICAAGGTSSYMSVMSFANSLMLDYRCLIIPRFVYGIGKDFSDQTIDSPEVKDRIRELVSVSTKIKYQ